MKRFLAILLAAMQVGSPFAATYYVDQTGGNDANAGTSAGSPWKNCPGMYTNNVALHTGSGVLAAGDVVYFDSSDTWQLCGYTNNPGCGFLLKAGVRYYGNGWPTTITTKPAGAGAKIQLISSSQTTDSGLIRINQDDATLTNYFGYFELDMNGTGAPTNRMANGVDINHGFGTNGITRGLKHIQGVWEHDQAGDQNANRYHYGMTASDQSTDASGWVANVLFEDCVVERPARDCFVAYPGNKGMVSNIVFRNCVAGGTRNDTQYGEGHGFVLKGWVKSSKIEYCLATNVNSSPIFINGPESGGNDALSPTNFDIRHNICKTLDNNGSIRTYGTGYITGRIYGNLTYPNESSGGLVMQGTTGVIDLEVYNNTFIGFVEIGNPTATITRLAFKNNIVYETDDPPMNDVGPDITSHSNNVYYRSSGGTLVISGGSTYTSGTLSTYEATALSSDPLLINATAFPTAFSGTYGNNLAPNNDGLALTFSSPAKDAGADLGSSFNTSISTISRPMGPAWDIGAYEFPNTISSRIKIHMVRMRK